MKTKLIAAPLIAVLAAGLIAAGCGDDDDTTTSAATTEETTGATGVAGPALSEDDFLAQANEICKQGDNAIDAEAEQAFSGQEQPSEADQTAFFEDTLIPGIQSQIDGLSELTPPEALQADVTQFLDNAQETLDSVSEDPAASFSGPSPFKDVEKEANAIGLTECAN